MKPTLTFYLLLITVALTSVHGQNYNGFDISKYYTPDIKRNQLDLTLSGSERYLNNEMEERKSNDLNGDFNASISHFTHTRKRYSSWGIGLTAEGSKSKYETDRQITRYSIFAPELSLSTQQRFYNPRNQFILLSGFARGKDLKMNNLIERFNPTGENEKNEERTKVYNYLIDAEIGLGKGRLESVEDARQAVYIIENLSKRGVLSRKLTDDEIFTLSQLISTVKNKRFFDSRLHRIEEISAVDSFFVKNDLLEKNNAPYFTTLYDYWEYGALFERLSGKQFKSSVSTEMQHSKYDIFLNDENTYHDKNNFANFHWVNEFSYEKPVNLFLQNSISATLRISRLQRLPLLTELIDYKSRNMHYSLLGSYGWSYYPNSRTRMSAGLDQRIGFVSISSFEGKRTFDNGGKFFTSSSSIGGQIDYYISPQLRFSASAGTMVGYQKGRIHKEDEKTSYLLTNLSGSFNLIYSIY